MVRAVVVYNNKEFLEKCKGILMPLKQSCQFFFTHLVEEALEYIDKYPTDIVVTGNDLGIMDCVEFFRTVQIANPKILKFLCMEINDIPETLKILNTSDVYHLVTLPLYFQEDLYEPIREAIQFVESKQIMDDKESEWSEEDEKDFLAFSKEAAEMYETEYLTQDEDVMGMFARLIERYNHPEKEQRYDIVWDIHHYMTRSIAGHLCFVAELMGLICKHTFNKYYIRVGFTVNERAFYVRFVCGEANAEYKDNRQALYKRMQQLVSEYLEKGYSKCVIDWEERPYVVTVAVAK